jgi:hypothetical protein
MLAVLGPAGGALLAVECQARPPTHAPAICHVQVLDFEAGGCHRLLAMVEVSVNDLERSAAGEPGYVFLQLRKRLPAASP